VQAEELRVGQAAKAASGAIAAEAVGVVVNQRGALGASDCRDGREARGNAVDIHRNDGAHLALSG